MKQALGTMSAQMLAKKITLLFKPVLESVSVTYNTPVSALAGVMVKPVAKPGNTAVAKLSCHRIFMSNPQFVISVITHPDYGRRNKAANGLEDSRVTSEAKVPLQQGLVAVSTLKAKYEKILCA